MAKLSKRVRAFREKVDCELAAYPLDEAIALLKEFGTAKFNETVEVAVNSRCRRAEIRPGCPRCDDIASRDRLRRARRGFHSGRKRGEGQGCGCGLRWHGGAR